MSATMSKDDAHKLIEQLPVNATWEDITHEIYIRETIEKGMADSQAGNITSVTDIRKKYGLPE